MSDALGSIIGGAAGAALGREGTTIQTFVLSLSSGFVLFAVQFGAFTILRNYLWAKRIYQPRSFLIPLKNRVAPPPNNIVKWLLLILKIPSATEVKQKAGMDAYFFLRYLTMCLKIFFPLACIILPILIPVNRAGGRQTGLIDGQRQNVTGLDTLAWSNVSPANTDRYWAHLFLALIVIGWTSYLFYRELKHYIITRQEFLASPSHRLKASSTTVLITDIPSELCTSEALTGLYDDLPGGIRRMWINRDYTKIVEKDDERTRIEQLLENAETDMLRRVTKQNRKQRISKPDHERDPSTNTSEAHEMQEVVTPDTVPILAADDAKSTTLQMCEEDLQRDIDTRAVWTQHIEPKKRPKMCIAKPNRVGIFKIPLIGRFFSDKVDTIYYCRRELARLNIELERDIEHAETAPPNGSAFIQFNTQKAAHLACQAVASTRPRQMLQRTVEISPADVNWKSLNYSWRNRGIRLIGFLALFILQIFIFGLISFFTGVLSRASTLAGSTSWLRWISSLPSWLLSFIQGTLPPFLQIFILSGPTPIIMRAMTNSIRGAITGSQGERSLQLWYFIFLLLELFVIPTISSGLTTLVPQLLSNPTSISQLLATDLPKASNYYFSFLIVQALSISAASIFQTVRMFNFYVIGGYNTPDSLWQKLTFTHLTRIGSNIPWYTTFATIGLVYSVIAPLILVFVLITFSLFWVVIKNNVLFVVRTGNVDSGGLWFPSAISQTFTGIYFLEVCLLALFFLVRDEADNVACEAQGTIMAITIPITIFYQIWLTSNFHGLYRYAPLQLEGIAMEQESEWDMQPLTKNELNIVMEDEKLHEEPGPLPDLKSTPASPHSNNSLSPEVSRMRGISTASSRPSIHAQLHDDHHDKQHTPRERRASIRSTAIVHRSQSLDFRKEHDKNQAKTILSRLNKPLDEKHLAALEERLALAEKRVGNVLLPRQKDIEARMMNDSISKIIMQHNDELEDLTAEERDMLISVAFTHPVLRGQRPAVWIPQDDFGVSQDELKRTRQLSSHLDIDNRGAFFEKGRKLKVQIDRAPPDMSEFALVMREL